MQSIQQNPVTVVPVAGMNSKPKTRKVTRREFLRVSSMAVIAALVMPKQSSIEQVPAAEPQKSDLVQEGKYLVSYYKNGGKLRMSMIGFHPSVVLIESVRPDGSVAWALKATLPEKG